jgi:hypothetical protein
MKDYLELSEDPTPTKTLPGTISKQIVLQKRAKLGLALHHKDDARLTDEINSVISKRIIQLKEDFPTETKICLYKKAIEEVSLYLSEGEVSLKEYEVFLSSTF